MNIQEIIKSNKPYVYILSYNNQPFYVGKGRGERLYTHERKVLNPNYDEFGLKEDYNKYKTRKIKKILKLGHSIEYSIVFYSDHQDLVNDKEKELIRQYGRKNIDKNGILCNIAPGGEGGDIFNTLAPEAKKEFFRKRKEKLDLKTPEEWKVIEEKRAHSRELNGTSFKDRRLSDQHLKAIRTAQSKRKGVPSGRKGIPASGGNAKGVRQAWNKNLDKDDPRMIAHKEGCKKFRNKNPDASVRMKYKLISPEGDIVEGIGMKSLTEKYNVSERIRTLILGRVDKYKGWIRA